MKQLTSIEWLIEEMMSKGFFKESLTLTNIDHLQYKAEELHKQEIIDAYGEGFGWNYGNKKYNGKEYYQETFVSKGSDDHISDISKMVELPQQEISDEEILLNSASYCLTDFNGKNFNAFINGAKWYREQLKCKGNGNK
jgi:hypothetical protein